jgi:hypothetical protein
MLSWVALAIWRVTLCVRISRQCHGFLWFFILQSLFLPQLLLLLWDGQRGYFHPRPSKEAMGAEMRGNFARSHSGRDRCRTSVHSVWSSNPMYPLQPTAQSVLKPILVLLEQSHLSSGSWGWPHLRRESTIQDHCRLTPNWKSQGVLALLLGTSRKWT